MKTITLNIEQEDIDNAVKRDSHRCMIADAVKKKYPTAIWIQVDLQAIRFSDKEAGKRYVYLTPPHGQAALIQFDQGKKSGTVFADIKHRNRKDVWQESQLTLGKKEESSIQEDQS